MKFPQILLLFVALVLSATEALPKGRVRSRREALQQARRVRLIAFLPNLGAKSIDAMRNLVVDLP